MKMSWVNKRVGKSAVSLNKTGRLIITRTQYKDRIRGASLGSNLRMCGMCFT